MHVERDAGRFAQALHDRKPDGEVRDEMVVHDVDVHPVRFPLDHPHLIREVREISGQDARGDDRRRVHGRNCMT
jgi:hypothetical protein